VMPADFNTLYHDLKCPMCGSAIDSGIGFRAGALKQASYRIGDKLSWEGGKCRPEEKPSGGNFRTVGYFNCDNLNCMSWHDCFPQVQEAVITFADDIIAEVQAVPSLPEEQGFDILPPEKPVS
jgi:hypothetical protein